MAEERRIAVVTGANRGIGLEVARQLVGDGLHVVIGSRGLAKRLPDDGPTGGFFRDGRRIDW